MIVGEKDYSGARYDIVREHHARPLPCHYEAYDRRRANNWPDHVESHEADETVEGDE